MKEANKYFAIDSGIALAVSFVINLAVVSAFAYHFFECVFGFVYFFPSNWFGESAHDIKESTAKHTKPHHT